VVKIKDAITHSQRKEEACLAMVRCPTGATSTIHPSSLNYSSEESLEGDSKVTHAGSFPLSPLLFPSLVCQNLLPVSNLFLPSAFEPRLYGHLSLCFIHSELMHAHCDSLSCLCV